MRLTAAQRRLLKEGSAGVLDYGPSTSGSPKQITQATPPGAPTHLGYGSELPEIAASPFSNIKRAVSILKSVGLGLADLEHPDTKPLLKALSDAISLLKNDPSSI